MSDTAVKSMNHSTHTQFLDLTNGEGGERQFHHQQHQHNHHSILPPAESEGTTEDGEDEDDGHHIGGGGSLGGGAEYVSAFIDEHDEDNGQVEIGACIDEGHHVHHVTIAPDNHPERRARSGSTSVIDPSTPGRVVESGQEQTGRWTKEEHDAFLSALQMFGKEWKKVAAKVKTRTVVQTRTHAQKYFQKLQKSMESGGGPITTINLDDHLPIPNVEMGLTFQKPRKASGNNSGGGQGGAALAPGMSGEKKKQRFPSIAAPKQNRRTSANALSAAQVISSLSKPSTVTSLSAPTAPTFVATGSSSTMSVPPRHGFSSLTEADAVVSSLGGKSAFASGSTSWLGSAKAKIILPDPSMRGFPEPSPAATGKRKLAELAAARMLAGVASVEVSRTAMVVPAAAESAQSDGAPTPPPMAMDDETSLSPSRINARRLNLRDAPIPPLFDGSIFDTKRTDLNSNNHQADRPSLSLQIVNPATLGITYQEQQKRRRHGHDTSPVTPWDGQLEALVSEKAEEGKRGAIGAATTDFAGENVASEGSDSPHVKCELPKTALLPVYDGSPHTFRRTPLHQAVCDAQVESVRELLESGKYTNELTSADDAGYYPLHTACALGIRDPNLVDERNEIVTLLLSYGADASQRDSDDNTPLHWAARSGDSQIIFKLISKNCIVDGKNKRGETPLHWAMRAGRRGAEVLDVLFEHGARVSIRNNDFRRPIDVAGYGFLDDPTSLASLRLKNEQGKKVGKNELKWKLKETACDRRESRSNLLIRSAHSRTLVLHHPECLEHHTKSESDWESPDRIRSIMRRVLPSSDSTGTTETSGIFPHEVTVSQEFDRAKIDLLSRVHSTEYLSFVNQLSKDLERQLKEAGNSSVDDFTDGFGLPPPVVPFTPLVQRSMTKIDDASVKLGMNSDTSFSAGSLRAARRAAGAVQHAVDCVLVGRNRNAFCVVRPPGHHAGIGGLLEGGESCGFCLFNNVAAGALYAISDDRHLCDRCAIVDIDVHHGNGTEEIVRKYHDPSKLFFFSIHLYDNDKKKTRNPSQFQYKFYPGTGSEDDLALNIINVPIVPLWKEATPSQTTAKTHNTRNKSRQHQEAQDECLEIGTGTPRESSRTSDVGSEAGSTASQTPQHQQASTSSSSTMAGPASSPLSGRLAYRQAIQNRLLPALRAFNPNLILISAGFDAAKGDVGNARHERGRERMGLDLEPEDYAWTTRKILEIADICCQGKVVSVLEGGYGRTPVAPQIIPGQKGLDRAIFAESAIRHLHAMIDPYDIEKRFDS